MSGGSERSRCLELLRLQGWRSVLSLLGASAGHAGPQLRRGEEGAAEETVGSGKEGNAGKKRQRQTEMPLDGVHPEMGPERGPSRHLPGPGFHPVTGPLAPQWEVFTQASLSLQLIWCFLPSWLSHPPHPSTPASLNAQRPPTREQRAGARGPGRERELRGTPSSAWSRAGREAGWHITTHLLLSVCVCVFGMPGAVSPHLLATRDVCHLPGGWEDRSF